MLSAFCTRADALSVCFYCNKFIIIPVLDANILLLFPCSQCHWMRVTVFYGSENSQALKVRGQHHRWLCIPCTTSFLSWENWKTWSRGQWWDLPMAWLQFYKYSGLILPPSKKKNPNNIFTRVYRNSFIKIKFTLIISTRPHQCL